MSDVFSWIFCLLLAAIGMLNIILIHLVPGLFYLVFSMIYIPPLSSFLKRTYNFLIPWWLKIGLGFLVMWGTMGVGDLMELLESRYL